jgi:hypothetical protein
MLVRCAAMQIDIFFLHWLVERSFQQNSKYANFAYRPRTDRCEMREVRSFKDRVCLGAD